MRSTISSAILALSALPLMGIAATNYPSKQAPVPYDADLYRKDTEVISAHGEFLYWTAQEGSLDYAQKMKEAAPAGTSCASGKVKSASYHLDPGFRIGMSYFNAPKYWEVRAQYTHIITRGKNSVSKPSAANEYLTGTWSQVLTDPITHAHSAIELNYNMFDLSIDRVFIPNPHLRVRMIATLSAAWISQDWKVHYFDVSQQNTTIRNRWKYVSGGIKMGLKGDWFWGKDIYLTGAADVGLYMGGYHNIAKQTASTLSLPYRNSDFKDTRPAFAAKFDFGPSWQKNFSHNRVELFVGYELCTWFNLQEIHRSSSGSASDAKETWINSSMLALQGLTTRLTIDF